MEFLCTSTDQPDEINCNGTIYYLHQNTESGGEIKPDHGLFWVYLLVYIFLVLFAGKYVYLCLNGCLNRVKLTL